MLSAKMMLRILKKSLLLPKKILGLLGMISRILGMTSPQPFGIYES